jgi:hypothetical protein
LVCERCGGIVGDVVGVLAVDGGELGLDEEIFSGADALLQGAGDTYRGEESTR